MKEIKKRIGPQPMAVEEKLYATWPGVIERYRRFLPVSAQTPVVTLLEGNTPLIPSRIVAKKLGRDIQLYFKYEGLNPTGSFKDRGMTLRFPRRKRRVLRR